jgi:peptide/nickel transport system substrate-binding protein
MLADGTLKSQQIPFLQESFLPRGGRVIGQPASYRAAMFQFRPELANPVSFLDVRVRKALNYAIDKEAVNEAIYQGSAVLTTNPFLPNGRYSSSTEPAAVRYPRDLRRAEQLMAEAGYTRDSDGFFMHPTLGRFTAELRTNASDQNETEMHVVADTWRRAGFDFSEAVTPPVLVQDSQTRATFSGVYIFGGGDWEGALRAYHTSLIPSAENRWSGGNRGGWRNAEWDRLISLYDTTLDHTQRGQIAAQLARIYTDELPAIAMEFDPLLIAYSSALLGPRGGPREGTVWNLHEWELK